MGAGRMIVLDSPDEVPLQIGTRIVVFKRGEPQEVSEALFEELVKRNPEKRTDEPTWSPARAARSAPARSTEGGEES